MSTSFDPLVFGSLQVWIRERFFVFNGVQSRPRARAFDLLLLLIENRDRVVEKSEIFNRVWQGLVVEENNLSVQIATLRKLLGPDVIATFPGRGYRFMLSSIVSAKVPSAESASLRLPDKPSIAVLPFLHLASDTRYEFFTDGITEDITTELSRFRSLFVISRQSCFTFKGRTVDSCTAAQELGVRYVVEGSVRYMTQKRRITVQLIDASFGMQVWADKFDGTTEDLFDIQDEIVSRISVAVAQGVQSCEFFRLRVRPANWGAYEIGVDAYQIANDAFNHSNQATRLRSLERAQEALSLDPGCVMGLEAKVFVLWQFLYYCTASDREATLKEANKALDKLEAIEGSNSMVCTYRGMLLQEIGESKAALECLRKAHQLNPNNVKAINFLAMLEIVNDQSSNALEHLRLTQRLSPLDPWAWSHITMLAFAYIGTEDYEQALHYSQMAVTLAPHIVNPHLMMTSAYVGLGELSMAVKAMTIAIEVGYRLVLRLLQQLASGQLQGDMMKRQVNLMLTATLLIDRCLMPEAMQELLHQIEAMKGMDSHQTICDPDPGILTGAYMDSPTSARD
jgi:TolB-like protein